MYKCNGITLSLADNGKPQKIKLKDRSNGSRLAAFNMTRHYQHYND